MEAEQLIDELIFAAREAAGYECPEKERLENERVLAEVRSKVLAMLPRPIPVSERLPGGDQIVLAFGANDVTVGGESPEWYRGYLAPKGWFTNESPDPDESSMELLNVTHWLPLPPAPEKES